jgi:hypothetical protein
MFVKRDILIMKGWTWWMEKKGERRVERGWGK